jgi:hypothetical protein
MEETMAEPDPQDLSNAGVKEASSKSVEEGRNIYEQVHDLTLAALSSRRFDRQGIRDVVRAVSEGATLGAETSRADMRQAVSQAFRGLDEALRKSAEAGEGALKQLVATGRDFSDRELKQALASMKSLENDFLSVVGQVTDSASARVAPELRRVLDEARQRGTETGKQVASTMTEFAQRFSSASLDVTLAGLEAATDFGGRFAQAASGILAGIADALAERRKETKDTPAP